MVDRNLIRSLESDDSLAAEIEALMSGAVETGLATIESEGEIDLNKIVDGRVIRVSDEHVLIDVGFKSEGVVLRDEWEEDEEPPKVGDLIKVLVEELEDGAQRADD
ncbi:MAG: S1 RNA-binding domain-containing protein, partial [Planctomycetales bacterium]|nr:S1 RNA-binding domain-containing protein [Planctomycetales bacterium]